MKLGFITILLSLVGLCVGCQLVIVDEEAAATPPPVVATTITETVRITDSIAMTDTVILTDTLTDTTAMTATATPVITATVALTTTAVTTATNPTDLAARGMEIYRQQYCGICHQLTATGSLGTFGPSHDGIATLAEQHLQDANYGGTATTATEYLHESLVDPKIYIVPGYEITSHHMPSYTFLPEADINALVAFLLQQK